MKKIHFWNGNKSTIRQQYESEILKAALQAADELRSYNHIIHVDHTDYPSAEDEGSVLTKGSDVLVTVAGNLKFSGKAFIPVNIPIAKGLLGYRILITRHDFKSTFDQQQGTTKQKLSKLKSGIPATWADADLFRHNSFEVFEKGSFDKIFHYLNNGECDYISLGANEVESVFESITRAFPNLTIEPDLVLYYPFPLVFYVHPEKSELARQLELGLSHLIKKGTLNKIFEDYFGDCLAKLNIQKRAIINLSNPVLPQVFEGVLTDTMFNK